VVLKEHFNFYSSHFFDRALVLKYFCTFFFTETNAVFFGIAFSIMRLILWNSLSTHVMDDTVP